ncbi:hypothetical protein F1559_004896 [Cyanidiococcus yangmingshanensis]|uniref:URB1 C-terminal domain-containing protein n=1 Tax=Cyanidiococcus yangmingshanensis TaxID=2690220 RepID=A0A7J7INP7_9RHOD|nr:hypothetical protein F1559_004896 [Cyanidiococcus yangmingshanensis]
MAGSNCNVNSSTRVGDLSDLLQSWDKFRDAAKNDLSALARALLSGLQGPDRRQAALVATALAKLLVETKTVGKPENQHPETPECSLSVEKVAQLLLGECRGVLQSFVASDQAMLVTGALRLLAAIAQFGSGYARETFLLVQPHKETLLELLRRQRQSRKRKRLRLTESEKRATPLERALLQWLLAGAAASETFSSDLRELYTAFLHQVLNRIRFRRGGSDVTRIFRILRSATWLNSGRILGNLLGIVEYIRNERQRSGLIELVARTRDVRSLAQNLASEKLGSAIRFRIAAAILRAGSPELASAFIEALLAPATNQFVGQGSAPWRGEQIALALIAFRKRSSPTQRALPRSIVLDSVSCCSWIAALESGSRGVPSLAALLEYIRKEALRSSKTLGSFRMARSLHLLRLCVEKRPEEIFHSGLDLAKIIPKAPVTVTYECPFTGHELVRLLSAARRNNRALKLATRLQDLLQLRELPRAPLHAFLLEFLNEYGLLRDPCTGETCVLEATFWFDLLRFAAPETLALFERVITEATSKPYAILDDAIHEYATVQRKYRPSPLYVAVERRLRTSPNPYLSSCLETIGEAMEAYCAAQDEAQSTEMEQDHRLDTPEKLPPTTEISVSDLPAVDRSRLEQLHSTSIDDVRDFVQNGSLYHALSFLASAEDETRRKAYDIAATFYELLPEAVEFRERHLVRAVLDLLRSSIMQPYQLIPRIHCVLFGSLAEIVANAAHELFPFARKVILQRPSWLLMEELPGAYEMLQSPNRRVQEFLLRLLLEGNDESRTFHTILTRHRLYSYLVGRKMFALQLVDRLRPHVDQVLERLLASPNARKSLERTWSLETWRRVLAI